MTAIEHFAAGTKLLKTGNARAAERELRAAVAEDERCAGAWVNLGGLLMSRWDFRGAIDANRRAAQIDPQLAMAPFNEALGHIQLGDAKSARPCLERAVDLQPGNGAAWFYLGAVLRSLGEQIESQVCIAYAHELGYREDLSTQAQGERHGAAQGR
jgi:tetratricopeptide (TPR) repeat protein